MNTPTPEHYSRLSARCRRLLVDGQGFDDYDSTHKVLATLRGGMHRAGWSEQQANEALLDTTNVASRRLQVTIKDGTLSVYGSKSQTSWDAIGQRHSQHEATLAELASILLTSWPYGGREDATLRVALGLVEIAKGAGQMTFTASQRQIAEVSGVGTASTLHEPDRKTVKRALLMLKTWGLIASEAIPASTRKEELFDALTAYTITTPSGLRDRLAEERLQTPTKLVIGQLLSSQPVNLGGCLETHPEPLHVVWEVRALGMSSCRTFYLLIEAGALAPAEIARRLQLSPKCVSNALKRLSEAKLVTQPKRLAPWSVLSRSLDDVADGLGVGLRQQMRSQAFALPRKARQQALTDRYSTRVVDITTGEITQTFIKPTNSQAHHVQAQPQPTITNETGFMDQTRQSRLIRAVPADGSSQPRLKPQRLNHKQTTIRKATRSSIEAGSSLDGISRIRITLVGDSRQGSVRRTTHIKRDGLGFRTVPVPVTSSGLHSEAVAA